LEYYLQSHHQQNYVKSTLAIKNQLIHRQYFQQTLLKLRNFSFLGFKKKIRY
jgi:hypothetical protein